MTLWVQDFVGTGETKGFATLTCSPNPVGDAVLLSTEMLEGKNIRIKLVDVSGKIWLTEKRMNVAPKELLNTGALPPGIYFVNIQAEGQIFSGRFVRE